MISQREVAIIKVAYPDVDSQLAKSAHMYICVHKDSTEVCFHKCQTYKPLLHEQPDKPPFNYIKENRNIDRNPFVKPITLIDLDKVFQSNGVRYLPECLTTRRRDICKGLFRQIGAQVDKENLEYVILDREGLSQLNSACTYC